LVRIPHNGKKSTKSWPDIRIALPTGIPTNVRAREDTHTDRQGTQQLSPRISQTDRHARKAHFVQEHCPHWGADGERKDPRIQNRRIGCVVKQNQHGGNFRLRDLDYASTYNTPMRSHTDGCEKQSNEKNEAKDHRSCGVNTNRPFLDEIGKGVLGEAKCKTERQSMKQKRH
jgi:hypothetical protein